MKEITANEILALGQLVMWHTTAYDNNKRGCRYCFEEGEKYLSVMFGPRWEYKITDETHKPSCIYLITKKLIERLEAQDVD